MIFTHVFMGFMHTAFMDSQEGMWSSQGLGDGDLPYSGELGTSPGLSLMPPGGPRKNWVILGTLMSFTKYF